MTVRCLRCGAPVTGLAQFCDDCAALQQPPAFSPTPPGAPGGPPVPGDAPVPVAGLPYTPQPGMQLPSQAPAYCPRCGSSISSGSVFCPACGERVAGPAMEYGGFWIRFVAAMIDGMIMFVVQLVVTLLVSDAPAAFVLQVVIGAAYTIGFWMAEGATPGKMAMGLKVVMADGNPLTGGAAILRYVGYFVNALTLGIGYLVIAFNPEKRGLHDYMAGTVVVRKK